ncbi:peroxiredoxin [Cellulomonas sp. 179-A 9B4 NHS]|uniref:peroxiredoxin n=1 Tax=Cellulomonas sp. 179-A 9B4 NHS TaxID=3142379 RepID=UPI0039A1DFAA
MPAPHAHLADAFAQLPPNLPAPVDDGAARHLPGTRLPAVVLPSTAGPAVDLSTLDRAVVFVYPMTGTPGVPLPDGWDAFPGARGCTAEVCSMRDHLAELRDAGAGEVLGLSGQAAADQRAAAERLHVPYPLLSDAEGRATRMLRLPTFELGGRTYLRRLTLVVRDGVVSHVFHPVFPPGTHADEVLAWLRTHEDAAAGPPSA